MRYVKKTPALHGEKAVKEQLSTRWNIDKKLIFEEIQVLIVSARSNQ